MNLSQPKSPENDKGQPLEAARQRDYVIAQAHELLARVVPFSEQRPTSSVDGRTATGTGALIMNHFPAQPVAPEQMTQEQMLEDAMRQINAL